MKFGKTLTKSQVPEWSRYYLGYKRLKGLLKQIKNGCQDQQLFVGDKNISAVQAYEPGCIVGKPAQVELFQSKLEEEMKKLEKFLKHKLLEYTKRITKIANQRQAYLSGSLATQSSSAPTQSSLVQPAISKPPADPTATATSGVAQPTNASFLSPTSLEPTSSSSHFELAHLVHHQKYLLSALLAIKFQLFQLVQFRELNYRGVIKILKKADKSLNYRTPENYIDLKGVDYPYLILGESTTASSLHAQCQEVTELADSIQSDLQKTLLFFDPNSEQFSKFGEVLTKRHNQLVQLLQQDDVHGLTRYIKRIDDDQSLSSSAPLKLKMIEMIFEHACFYGALCSIGYLLESNLWLLEVRDIDERSIFHKLALFGTYCSNNSNSGIAATANSTMVNESPVNHHPMIYPGFKRLLGQSFLNSNNYSPLRFEFGNYLADSNQIVGMDSVGVFQEIIKTVLRVKPNWRDKVMDIDIFGRRPLHYAALNNYPQLYREMAEFVEQNGLVNLSEWWYDLDGCSPLFYAILKGHVQVLAQILILFPQSINVTLTLSSSEPMLHTTPLGLAANLGYPDIITQLLQAGASPFEVNENGESPLHLAAKHSYIQSTQAILTSLAGQKDQLTQLINLKDSLSNHTALMLAVMEGNLPITQMLIDGGADLLVEDSRGWRAYEYAILYGYIELADILSLAQPISQDKVYPKSPTTNSSGEDTSKNNDISNGDIANIKKKHFTPLIDQCAIVITLGTNDVRSPVDPIEFFPEADLFTELNNLKLVISTHDQPKQLLGQIDLPSRGDEPIVYRTELNKIVHLYFDILPTTLGTNVNNELIPVARGSFRVDCSQPSKIKLHNMVSLLRAPTLEVVGHVNLECILVTPYQSVPKLPLVVPSLIPSETRVIGHRGMGANQRVAGSSTLQVGENTVLSFITAANLGAEYVEFDIQVTKDGVPVLYHDFTVTESGYDIPMHSLTHHQFINIYHKIQKPTNGKNNTKEGYNTSKLKLPSSPPKLLRRRSNSMDTNATNNNSSVNTNDSTDDGDSSKEKSSRIKGNNPTTIQSPFVTLEATFRDVPGHVGFNMEVKYPMVDEAEEAGFHGSELELNWFIDNILKVVGAELIERGSRPMMFSSFHPEICLLLRMKQSSIPVFFLSDCGYTPIADARCNSLRAATRFASAHHLTGLVVLADPLLAAPRLLRLIREAGLNCFTYGSINNHVEAVIQQKAMGMDAVIVDSVAHVTRGLKSDKQLLTSTPSKDWMVIAPNE